MNLWPAQPCEPSTPHNGAKESSDQGPRDDATLSSSDRGRLLSCRMFPGPKSLGPRTGLSFPFPGETWLSGQHLIRGTSEGIRDVRAVRTTSFVLCCILKSATCSQMLARSVIWGPVKLTTVFSSHAMATYRYVTARGLRGREELVQLLHLHRSTCPICVPNSQFPSCSLSLGLPEISSRRIRMSFVPSPIRDIRARHYLTRSATCGSP